MSGEEQQNGKWAPWWIYVPVILGSNYVKQYLVQDLPVAVNAVITLVLVGTLFLNHHRGVSQHEARRPVATWKRARWGFWLRSGHVPGGSA